VKSDKQDRDDGIQGEGNVAADRRYREGVRQFVRDHDVERAAREAEPSSAAERAALKAAEQAGRERSKGEDQTDVMEVEERDTSCNDPQ
jgi:hypothetical protein